MGELGHELWLLCKRIVMGMVAALAIFGLLIWLALVFGPLLVKEIASSAPENYAPIAPVLENQAPVERPNAAQRQAGCKSSKRTCADMHDCAEARFYLETCGLSRMDGDKDGIPCESMCDFSTTN